VANPPHLPYQPIEIVRGGGLMSDRPDEREQVRKPYAKPEVQQVSLRPEEAVLGSCKTAAVSGPGQFRCSSPSACSSLSS